MPNWNSYSLTNSRLQRRRLALTLLEAERDALRCKLDRRFTAVYVSSFQKWKLAELRPSQESDQYWQQFQFLQFLITALQFRVNGLAELETNYREFLQRSNSASGADERLQHTLDFLQRLGSKNFRLHADRRAFNRWFEQDGVIERFQHFVTEQERHIVYLLERLGPVAYKVISSRADGATGWKEIQLEPILLPLLTDGHERVREAAMAALGQAMEALPPNSEQLLSTTTVGYLYRCALDPLQPLWLQCKVLSILCHSASAHLEAVFLQRVELNPHHDDFFFRRRLLLQIVEAFERRPKLGALVLKTVQDPSPYVRQALAESLPRLTEEMIQKLLPTLANDPIPCVQAALLLTLAKLVQRQHPSLPLTQALEEALAQSRSNLVLRTGLHIAPIFYQAVRVHADSHSQEVLLRLERAMTALHQQHPATSVRRWAAHAREHLLAMRSMDETYLRPFVQAQNDLDLGDSKKLRRTHLPELDQLGRRLVPLGADHFGLNLVAGRRSIKIVRDHRRQFRLWRMLHEWNSPATDKRQNYSHLQGRIYPGLMQIPAHQVAELSQTKIPGEPLHIADEGGWRPYLPLVDQLISALDQDWPTQPLKIFTAEGITWVTPPSNLITRLRARWRLTRRFEYYAQLRNWTPDSSFSPQHYLQEVAQLGFLFKHTTYTDTLGASYPPDSRIQRFFPVLVFPTTWAEGWKDFQNYFYSVYQNTLEHLLIFVLGMAALFFGNHIYLNIAMRFARRNIPLVVGGWGTRGKSGTERLKAAVFNALGYQVLSKTTGCEAMFLHGHSMRPLREMFLFRPYDKATIWEQVSLVRLAAQMKVDVMLWECMGLNPRYVDILQNQWMRDDLSTITNCYPDHEDIQGPAGVDVPRVIARFIRRKGRLITSEENMLPYLREEARHKKTSFDTVNWLQAGLIAPDVLARFPYEEHPYNIALVVRMSETLGIPADFALKEMADRVIPDLGVLKAYPKVSLHGRSLEFINGMSANERHGTLSNWQRMGMDTHDLEHDPATWISTVVNNRADRVARSQVFANVLVNDISADRHFLIGGNLDGLMTYITHAFKKLTDSIDWGWQNLGQKQERLQLLERLAKRFRVPGSAQAVAGRLSGMLRLASVAELRAEDEAVVQALITQQSLPEVDAVSVLQQWRQDHSEWRTYNTLRKSLENDGSGAISEQIHSTTWAWFSKRLHVVEDYHTSGNQLIDRIALDTPPNLFNRVMGIQNIKGTGLDFMYRWQAWDFHYREMQRLQSDDARLALQAAKLLASSQEFGLLEERPVLEVVERMRHAPLAQNELFQAELSLIEANLQQQVARTRLTLGAQSKTRSWFDILIQWIETFLDSGEAVRRRKQAEKIYRDLAKLRISHARAAYELKLLTQAQKGGWLNKRLEKYRIQGRC